METSITLHLTLPELKDLLAETVAEQFEKREQMVKEPEPEDFISLAQIAHCTGYSVSGARKKFDQAVSENKVVKEKRGVVVGCAYKYIKFIELKNRFDYRKLVDNK